MDEWILHYRLGHLSFIDLNVMQKNNMVTGFSLINIQNEVCEECVQVKQHRGIFSKNVGCRTKCHLEVVYSYVYGPMQVHSF